ncbi:MAG: 7TM diverse intracellular signaling domain-containing protein [Cytophagaceae bacterium]
MKLHILYLLLFFLNLPAVLCVAQTPLYLQEGKERYIIRGGQYAMLPEEDQQYSIHEILKEDAQKRFSINKTTIPYNDNFSTYWIKIIVNNQSGSGKHWLFEFFDFRIDHLELYLPDGKGSFILKTGGDIYSFRQREYKHKNFVYSIPLLPDQAESIIYARVTCSHPVALVSGISSHERFLEYANTEYLLLALFYGIILALSIYNLLIYFSVRNRAYLYYVLHVLSIGVYSLTQDGLGFQYVWPFAPALNTIIFPLSLYFMIIFGLLLARRFLSTRRFPMIDKIILSMIILRSLILIAGFTVMQELLYYQWIDLMFFVGIYGTGMFILSKGYKPARFYVLAFTILFFGFLVSVLKHLNLISDSILTVYSFNFGVITNMLLISYAFADKIKYLIREKDFAQMQTIVQLKTNEELKDRLNKDLEEVVLERTSELQEKNKQLDTFVYRASHDIKGPLKSIMGLTTVGLKDVKDPVALNYLEHIGKSTQRLDNILKDLLLATKVKEAKIEKTFVNCHKLVSEIIASFEHLPEFSRIQVCVEFDKKLEIKTDEKLLYSIFQNLIENAIKYQDPNKEHPSLSININSNGFQHVIEFIDNGQGIETELQDKVFDMFFKANDTSSGSGLGLHIVKMTIEKLGGKISLQSEKGVGSNFKVVLPV